MIFAIVIAVPFILAALTFTLKRWLTNEQQAGVMALIMLALFGLLMSQLPEVKDQHALEYAVEWMPQLGLELSLYIDGLALLFGAVITGIGAVIVFYTGYYFSGDSQYTRFNMLLLAFSGSMLGVVMAGNLITLFVAWELTSIISFLLIGFKGAYFDARSGASQALIITAGGGLALFAGLLIAGQAVGSYSVGDVLASGDLLRDHPWYTAITILILFGAFTKSAQFPFHFWLPGAMAAPTPASAYLHSATMVKAGIYLLARFYPVLGDTDLWTTAVPAVGLTTMFVGAVIAMRQRDLKAILAYSTVSKLGAIVALIGLPHSEGIKAAMIGILAHALYKCTLFLIAGTIDHATGTRDINRLRGLRKPMPGLAAATALVTLSMAGVPPLLGFVAKEQLIEAFIHQPLELAVVVISATLTVTVAIRLFWDVFMGDEDPSIKPHHIPPLMAAAPGSLAVLSVITGLGIAPLLTPLVEPAVGKATKLYLFPPGIINDAFLFSLLALGVGFVLFALRRYWLAWELPAVPGGSRVYEAIIGYVERAGDYALRLQQGRIRYYLSIILVTVALLLSITLVGEIGNLRALKFEFSGGVADILKIALLFLTLAATLASILFERHLMAALALAVSGYSIGGLFLLEPAPDVALVQFLVETLATVLIFMILARANDDQRQAAIKHLWQQTRRGLVRDVVISLVIGTLIGIFALSAVSNRPNFNTISTWHLENALPKAGVSDVVAAILTDFRGTDTLLEISVFAMASLGVLTMLARPTARQNPPLFRWISSEPTPSETDKVEDRGSNVHAEHFADPITRVAAQIVLPIAFLIAFAHILYGGVMPGDGFTAGVIAGLGITLWFIVYGYEDAKARLYWLHPAPLIGFGLFVALGNASLPLLFGRDFLSLTKISGIDFADIKVASTVLFEIGIFLTVFGGVSAIMEALTHPQEAESL